MMHGMTVQLDRVPETLLWTLYHRALEAHRSDHVVDDPMAIDLVERIDFPFRERFGSGQVLAQWQALRARRFDEEIRRFLAAHPDGTVVALGEGLETQSWRVDNGRMRWVTVDFPEVIELRRELLPQDERRTLLASSALDFSWLDHVAGDDVLVTAQGVLMYLEPEDVHELIARIGEHFPTFVFDAVPSWIVGRRLQSGSGYEPPPWSWGMGRHDRRLIGRQGSLRRLRLPRGRGLLVRALGRMFLSVWRLDYSSASRSKISS
jgi:O-methyltransferase involved in polyketide biosynthesis